MTSDQWDNVSLKQPRRVVPGRRESGNLDTDGRSSFRALIAEIDADPNK